MDTLLTQEVLAANGLREERRHPTYRDPDEWQKTHIVGYGDVWSRWYCGHHICVDVHNSAYEEGKQWWMLWIDQKCRGASATSLEQAERNLEAEARNHPVYNFEIYYGKNKQEAMNVHG